MSKIIISIYVLATSFGLIILKSGAKAGPPISYANGKLLFNINRETLIGLFLYGLSFILYIYLISKYELGYIIPLLAASVYILVFFASYIVFKEVFTITKILGITLIVFGLMLLNLKA